MNKRLIPGTLLAIILGVLLINISESEEKEWGRIERKIARADYFKQKLRDPVSGEIPRGIRNKELAFSEQMDRHLTYARTESEITHTWQELGPSDVGGRTRAIGVDVRNSSIVIVAGVTGGIWRSTDGGASWISKLPAGSNLSITSIAQDPNNNDIWYAGMGERSGSAGKVESPNLYFGAGIYKSTDNGISWTLMSYDFDGDALLTKRASGDANINGSWDHPLDMIDKIVAFNQNGATALYVVAHEWGIWKSTDGGTSFSKYSADFFDEDAAYSDIMIDKDGIVTVWYGPTDSGNNGFFRSYDGGNNFFDITPTSYPTMSIGARCLLALAPSSPSTFYAFIYDGDADHHFYAFDMLAYDNDTGAASIFELSQNLPDWPDDFGGEFTTQDGYDMSLAVHPQDSDLVVLGYTNLIKSHDGFATAVVDSPEKYWIGGYENPHRTDDGFGYHHADQHTLFFDPNDPNKLWAGHDGGLSVTADVSADAVTWESKNNGYNVTQYYVVAISDDKSNPIVAGGTQDNGTPYHNISGFSGSLIPSLGDISSGDGAYCYIGDDLIYTSAQEGAILVRSKNALDDALGYFEPAGVAVGFIHPFTVDPNDEGTLYYADTENGFYLRNTKIDEAFGADDYDQAIALVNDNWEKISFGTKSTITAMKVSDQSPASRLYFGGENNQGKPYIAYLDNANTSTTGVVNSVNSKVTAGAYLADIAINPLDGNEILLAYSNYNIDGLYHSTDGGATLTSIEGNLGDGDTGTSGVSGPSLRAAEIIETTAGVTKYIVATSIGVYSTELLSGSNTVWTSESSLLKNMIVEDLDVRSSDQTVLAGTHGRGLFLATWEGGNNVPVVADTTLTIAENSDSATVVGVVTASDADGDDLTYSISDGNAGDLFAIDSTNGTISVDKAMLDFESTSQYVLKVKVKDVSTFTEATITISVTNVNEAPVLVTDLVFSLSENSPANTSVGTVAGTDPDGDRLTYTIVDGNTGNGFQIDTSGVLSVNDSAAIDFELIEQFMLSVMGSDGSLSDTVEVQVDVLDLDDVLGVDPTSVLSVYPNPAVNKIQIGGFEDELIQVSISDLSGKVKLKTAFRNSQFEYLDVSDVFPGYYLLRVVGSKKTLSTRLIIGR
ncbi:MAG: cadherin domain-containing protein [Cyclobacteriaceae bacterium]